MVSKPTVSAAVGGFPLKESMSFQYPLIIFMESAAPEEDSVPPRVSGSRFYDCLNAQARTITTVPHVLSLQRTAERTREYLNQFQENKVCL